MKKFFCIFFFSLAATVCFSCSDNGSNETMLPQEPDSEESINPGADGNYDNIGIEYDDGTNIVMHVKIAIDKEGWDMRDETFFKTGLKKHW